MRTRRTYTCTHTRRSVSAVEEPHDLRSIGMYGERKTNARCPCTPQSTVETFSEEISAEACSGKEIAGLLRKMMMMNMMTRKCEIAYERILAWQTGGR